MLYPTKPKKNAKVIATYFGPRRRHPHMVAETIEWLKGVVQLEQNLDKGDYCDTIIVNHDVTPFLKNGDKAIDYLRSIDGMLTRNGIIKILHREWNRGIGGSFGSFSYAFGKFRKEYYYWFFTEDNVVQVRGNYLKESIDLLKKTKGCFVCALKYRTLRQTLKHHPAHCHGGCGVAHVSTLSRIYDYLGRLPHCEEPIPASVQKKIESNEPYKFDDEIGKRWYEKFEQAEINFTNIIVRNGGFLVDLDSKPLSKWLGKVY